KNSKDASLAAPVDVPAADASAGPFYTAIGGESLGRVAYTLYGDYEHKKLLLDKNSGLPKTLPAGQPVYFDFSDVKPQPMYLTKDLLDRYPSELSDKIKSASAMPTGAGTVSVQAGESLQMVSQRLYGTTRYWPELYLLNHDKISHYDKVSAGMTLAMYEHGAAKNAPVADLTPAPSKVNELRKVESTRDTFPAKDVTTQAAPVAQPTMDPIPETIESETPAPSAVTAVTPPAPVTQPVVTPPAPVSMMDKITDSNNANLRRLIYILLIGFIGGAAFYFTRPQRRSKIDMLDVTAGSTAPPPPRSRLGAKETTRKTIGG
ncbi:MAG: hypothetical protein ACXWQJ_15830, partial [Bdellovibrionota bacterium]